MKTSILAGVILSVFLLSSSAYATCYANMAIAKPDSIYTDHGNGTVTDNQTGLVWMKCSHGLSGISCATGTATTMNWKQALEAAQTANVGIGTFGYTDWRLPTAAELSTLIEVACSPSINTTQFPATVSGGYWSASPYANPSLNNGAWVGGFSGGVETVYAKNHNHYVRLVRGGQ